MSRKELVLENLLIWACVYPSVMLFSFLLDWLEIELELWLEILISTGITVPFISFVAAPVINRLIGSRRNNEALSSRRK